jgi:hypothetical protein
MEAVHSSKMLATTCKATWCKNPEVYDHIFTAKFIIIFTKYE